MKLDRVRPAVLGGAFACLLTSLLQPGIANAEPGATAHPALWPKAASPGAMTDAATEAAIGRLMARMTLEEKVGQTVQGDISTFTPEDFKRYPLGSVLAGGDSGPGGDDRAPALAWVRLAKAFHAAALDPHSGHTPIPIMFGVDAVHGHNNIPGAVIFPHNVGLGAARDPDLVGRVAAATAEEVAATGVDWTFGPTVAVPRDVRWGRSYEGYAEEPEVVEAYAGPVTLGLQGMLKPGQPLAPDKVAGSAKHFLGDGGTSGGHDQGDAQISEHDLLALHSQGYPPAIDAGVLTVMTSFSSWNGVKHAANQSLITGVLKGRMGFNGFVIDDWNAHGQIPGCLTTDCPAAMNAGLDMYMAPDSWRGLYDNLLREVKTGVISQARLDDAVRRILRVKMKLELFQGERPLTGRLDLLGTATHRDIARRAVRESLVLLKNDGVLPVKPGARVLVAGEGADDIGRQCGGWTISWQGTGNRNSDFPHGESIWRGVQTAVAAAGGKAELAVDGRYTAKPDVAIVVFGETPYAEFQGDLESLEYQPEEKRDLALLKRLKAQHIPVVSVFLSGRPLWTNPEINDSDAFVAAWLPGSEGEGVADLLIAGRSGAAPYDFRGKLSFSWPRLAAATPKHRGDVGYDPQFAYGYGLSYAHPAKVGRLSEDPGLTPKVSSSDRYFVSGRTPPPWTFSVAGDVTLKAADAGAQESARLGTWSGEGELSIKGDAVNLSRQATGNMALMLRYKVEQAADEPVHIGMGCGEGCAGFVDATSLFSKATSEWRSTKIKLSCFMHAGAKIGKISEPLAIRAAGKLTLTLEEVALEPDEGDAICPA